MCCNRGAYVIKDSEVGEFLVRDLATNSTWIISSVYGPNDKGMRANLWSELDFIRCRWSEPWCLGGDWNVTRFPSERVGDH